MWVAVQNSSTKAAAESFLQELIAILVALARSKVVNNTATN